MKQDSLKNLNVLILPILPIRRKPDHGKSFGSIHLLAKQSKQMLGQSFWPLYVDKHFKDTSLGKYFNRSTIKVSYSCMPNLDTIISGHNKKVLNQPIEPQSNNSACNCRGGTASCPLNGQCQNKERKIFKLYL